jgi:hypothetical protein
MLTNFRELQWMTGPIGGEKIEAPVNVWNVAALLHQLIIGNPPGVIPQISVSDPSSAAKRLHAVGIEIMRQKPP